MPALPATFDLTGKTALVTGGAGLLGYQHAKALADVGAHVVLADIDVDGLANTVEAFAELGLAERIDPLVMDVTDPASIEAAGSDISAKGRRIEILLNNAAIDSKVGADGRIEGGGRLESFPLGEWRRQMDVGLTGAFLCAKAFGPEMAAHQGGTILNIASDLSVIAPDQRLYRDSALPAEEQTKKPVTYSVIKTGLVGLTRYLAAYWADAGVRVNALSPGGVENGQPDDFVERLTDLIPLGRMAAPDEYAGAIQFLCSDASLYMTGQNIVIDGGRSVL